MVIGIGLLCMNHAGTLANPLDITPNFGSVVLGLTQTAGTLSGCIAPLVAGYLTKAEVSIFTQLFLIARLRVDPILGDLQNLTLWRGGANSPSHLRKKKRNFRHFWQEC